MYLRGRRTRKGVGRGREWRDGEKEEEQKEEQEEEDDKPPPTTPYHFTQLK